MKVGALVGTRLRSRWFRENRFPSTVSVSSRIFPLVSSLPPCSPLHSLCGNLETVTGRPTTHDNFLCGSEHQRPLWLDELFRFWRSKVRAATCGSQSDQNTDSWLWSKDFWPLEVKCRCDLHIVRWQHRSQPALLLDPRWTVTVALRPARPSCLQFFITAYLLCTDSLEQTGFYWLFKSVKNQNQWINEATPQICEAGSIDGRQWSAGVWQSRGKVHSTSSRLKGYYISYSLLHLVFTRGRQILSCAINGRVNME